MANSSYVSQPMRIQARPGSLAERRYCQNSGLPQGGWPRPAVIAPGISPKPLSDLILHGGKLVPQMEFQNVFLGGQASWEASDIDFINSSITLAMQHVKLNNVIKQFFVDIASLTCDPRTSVVLAEPKPAELDEPDVQQTVVRLLKAGKLSDSDLGTVIFRHEQQCAVRLLRQNEGGRIYVCTKPDLPDGICNTNATLTDACLCSLSWYGNGSGGSNP
jgi:hypothetical protein